MCSGEFSARLCGTDRLTSQPGRGEMVVPGEKKKVKSTCMKAPHMSLVYNGTMWTVDIDDFQALSEVYKVWVSQLHFA